MKCLVYFDILRNCFNSNDYKTMHLCDLIFIKCFCAFLRFLINLTLDNLYTSIIVFFVQYSTMRLVITSKVCHTPRQ